MGIAKPIAETSSRVLHWADDHFDGIYTAAIAGVGIAAETTCQRIGAREPTLINTIGKVTCRAVAFGAGLNTYEYLTRK